MKSWGVLALVLFVASAQKTIDDMRGTLFSSIEAGYYDVYLGDFNQGTTSAQPGNRLTTFIDLNNDKKTDLVTVSDSGNAIRVYLYHSNKGEFVFDSTTYLPDSCSASSISFSKKGITLVDISDDGTVEMLVTKNCQGAYTMSVYEQKSSTNPDQSNSMFQKVNAIADIAIADNSQPILGDFNGDFRTDIMYMDPTKTRKVAMMDGTNTPDKRNFEDIALGSSYSSHCLDGDANAPFAVPHSSGFADFDGDCASDLLLVTKSGSSINLEIWASIPKEQKFCLVQQKQISSSEYSQIAISDFNQDGAVDLIYLGAMSKTLRIHYNKRVPGTTQLCTIESVTKTGYPIFEFTNTGNDFIKIKNFLESGESLFSANVQYPFTIRVGDLTLDSYPEIMLTVIKSGQKATYAYQNVACSDSSQRCFYPSNRKLGDRMVGSEYAAFFDLDENGEVDVLYGVKNSSGNYEIKGLYNHQETDSFFLKTFTIRKKGKYGDVIYGVNYRFVKTESFSTNIVLGGTQLSQSAYNALQMPYCLFGIGRSKDYIKQFKVALVADREIRIKNYSPIIPNSQLIITATGPDTANWILELFINPTDKIWLICIIIACFLIILFTIVLILQIREYKKDQRDNYVGPLY